MTTPRNAGTDEPQGVLVVGVDGSAATRRALAWAVQQARRTHRVVHAVSVCSLTPPPTADALPAPPAPPEELDALSQAHEDLLDTAVRRAAPERQGVVVHQSVIYGEPGPTLCAMAGKASALVVGSHGRDPGSPSCLGSVSSYCVCHARCPVVVIPFR
ncbi:universal stress protein [Actinopolymorpha alba]|uniref:universal stress protein n=1 Tax=Actinopolymorpha alba TaxID=533267 RepID=UPI000378A3EF|nr:universal stress protein [Actinopolymorpha alba]